MQDLPVIQKMYDFILWYVPLLNKMPRDQKFILGDRIQGTLYDLLEGLIMARYDPNRVAILQRLNARLDVLRFQTRLCVDMKLMTLHRHEFASRAMIEIGQQIGSWLKQQQRTSRQPQGG
ncbi:MAG: diversity-generating retroelement protein Avd [Candidatus Sumerlaeota bacterium]|nr:diversity-generating retroelement protein Avd [Candidatus Sumerlaeota bacterium]